VTSSPDFWVRIETPQGARHAHLKGDDVVPIEGSIFEEWRPAGDPLPLKEARLLAPVIPPTFYACGINYKGHWQTAAAEFGLDPDKTWPRTPEIGYRSQGAIIGPGQAIVLPSDVPENVQVEAELAVVIGRRASKVRAEDALDHVFGYTICNDVSARGWQFTDRTFWRSKNADTFKPLGPWIRRGVDLDRLVTRVSVNGELRESFPTARMIFSVAEWIEAITRYATLVPGDVIIMGTDGHCPAIVAGDVVSITIDGIGTLENPVLQESTS
jgi:2-keto-4-pentenoate hydratase/2-oxohepta-3-ene-1,7-dioic acid hydratase in catechol pathway